MKKEEDYTKIKKVVPKFKKNTGVPKTPKTAGKYKTFK